MLKTITKIALVILTFSLLLSGCSADKNFKVSDGPLPTDTVSSNGGMVVQKGNFVYFINGISSTNAKNAFGEPVKGSVVRMDLTTKDTVIVVPKVVLSSYTKGGIYIFGNKIYYTSPSVEKDKNGNRLSSYLDYFSANLDGSGTKKILTTISNSFAYKFFEKDNVVYLIYIDTTKGTIYLVNTENSSRTVVLDNYTGTPILADDGNIYFTKAVYKDENKDETFTYNRLFKISYTGGQAEEIKLADNETTITQDKFTVTLREVKIFGNDTVLYYTKRSATDIPDPITVPQALFCYKIGAASDFLLLANAPGSFDFTNIIYLSEKTFIGAYGPEGQQSSLYYVDCEDYNPVRLMPNPSKILKIDGDYIYYLKDVNAQSVLYKKMFNVADANFEIDREGEEVLADISFTISGLDPEIIGDYIYFVRADGDYINYMYRFNLNDSEAEAELISIIAEEDKID